MSFNCLLPHGSYPYFLIAFFIFWFLAYSTLPVCGQYCDSIGKCSSSRRLTNDDYYDEDLFEESRSLFPQDLYLADDNVHGSSQPRYLLYDVSVHEGFNLRRDVYIRMATLVKRLGPRWTLVLPEWVSLPHWHLSNDEEEQRSKRWSTYFELKSMSKFINVIELEQFVANVTNNNNQNSKAIVDDILSLEHSDTFYDNEFQEGYEMNETDRTYHYDKRENGQIYNVYDSSLNDRITFKRLHEIKIEGFVTTLFKLIRHHFPTSNVLLISNTEIILHSNYGDKVFWMVRQSMRFAQNLQSKGNLFRKQFLNSDDETDGTVKTEDWRQMKRKPGEAIGGPYLAVHLRRQDFVRYRPGQVPSLDCASHQIHFVAANLLDKHIEKIYISTDADMEEYNQLKKDLEARGHLVYNYAVDSNNRTEQLCPGELAILDQWISSHAEIFIGTLDSTFSFKIQEEREILGFETNRTFLALCPKCDLHLMLKTCKQKSVWKIVY